MFDAHLKGFTLSLTENDLLCNCSKSEDDGSGHAKSIVNLSLPSSVKEIPSVAKLYSFLNQLTYSDGLAGALLATTKEFLTSPNCDYLPDPPLGSTRNLYCRSDARYGQDDPICWPQPYNPRYPFYAAISKKPTDPHSFESSIMWLDLREGDLSFTSQGEERKEGIVKSEIMTALQRKIALLKPRVSVFYEGNPDSTRRTFLKENIDSIDLFLTRLGTVSAMLCDQQHGLTELQRAYLTAKAILDFHRLVEKSRISDSPATVDTDKMGCFVWNDTEARMLYFAGLPVFYIHPWSAFDHQIIEKVVPLQQPCFPPPANPPYRPILTSQAGSDGKFGAICMATHKCFETISPFENMHLPGAYASSYVIGQGRIMAPASSPASTSVLPQTSQPASRHSGATRHPARKSYKQRQSTSNPPKPQCDIFGDLPKDDPLVPPVIPAWRDVNETIRQDGVTAQKKLLVAPDAGLFFGLQTESRQTPYFFMWQHFRPVYLRGLRAGTPPRSVEFWRKMLAYPFLNLVNVMTRI
ncbi:hypothetical protein BDP27DRAFT_1420146 [Rhodocollybia butyracea]|uniref:Uncharacterized protein n=1 Tax=Rhodocollybia butyracea TaxID=206335 RepID=A0A9P5PQF0_9AGAR|nr:hypothetical protein BDP27DRAFT_1420146 [Rhodocollybia butyracea]